METKDSKGNIVVLGVFDGVHLGHQQLIKEGLDAKKRLGLPLWAVTFHPHPKNVTGKGSFYSKLLTPTGERQILLEETGADRSIVIPFTREFSRLSPEEFVEDYLVSRFNAKYVLCGYDFGFAYKGGGRPEDLLRLGKTLGFEVNVVPPFEIDGTPVSSTRVRECLSLGEAGKVKDLLGRPYAVTGLVVPGDSRGRNLGFPTANLQVGKDKLLPGRGVYVGLVRFQEDKAAENHIGVLNVGIRPTFSGKDLRVEVHVLGVNRDFYGRRMQVLFLDKLREEMSFASPLDLKAQIGEDVRKAMGFCIKKEAHFNLQGAYDRILTSRLP